MEDYLQNSMSKTFFDCHHEDKKNESKCTFCKEEKPWTNIFCPELLNLNDILGKYYIQKYFK